MNKGFQTKNRRPLTSIDVPVVPGPESHDGCKANVYKGFRIVSYIGVHLRGLSM